MRASLRSKAEAVGIGTVGVVVLCLGCGPPRPGTPDAGSPLVHRHLAHNPIPEENQLPGASDWRIGPNASGGRLDLYTSTDSVEPGDTVRVKVSADRDSTITAELFRIGHYGGAGARRVWNGGPYPVSQQPSCQLHPSTARVECDWTDTFSLTIDPSWLSGLYVVKVRRAEGYVRMAPFVIRDRRAADILYTPNFTTYQAYNTWGGESLYTDDSGTIPGGKAWEVSFDRPYLVNDGLGKTFWLDAALVQLLERHGYDVTYGTQLDFIRFSGFLEGIGAFVHGGHDEYWPSVEREQVDAALASGQTSLAYFGANGGYWRIRLIPNTRGDPLRTIVCYKNHPEQDPIPYSTIRFRDPPNANPENNLFGVMYEGWQLLSFPLVVGDPAHWLFDGTGLTRGTLLLGLLGYEYDRAFPDWPDYPAGVQVSMVSPVVSAEGVPSYANTVDRTLPSGRLVFAAGSIWWARGLAEGTELYDSRVERMTRNVLERALAHRRPPSPLPPASGPVPARPPPDGAWAQAVEAYAGRVGERGHRDGLAPEALFDTPTGLAVTAGNKLVVADTGGNRIRLVRPGSPPTVITLAGTGAPGYRDGPGAQAIFRRPTGVAVDSGGNIYVADSDNHVIRRLQPGASGWAVSTVAGIGRSIGFADGPALQARFNRPTALTVDAAGNVYVADQANNRIRMLRTGTVEVVTIAGSGAPGSADAAEGRLATFNNPSALALGKNGELYVLDVGQLVRRISADPAHRVDTLAGRPGDPIGFADGTGVAARFLAQLGLAVEASGSVLVADTANYRVRRIVPGTDAASTRVFTLAGSGQYGTRLGTGEAADIVAPTGLATSTDGRIYVSDSYHHVIRAITR